MYFFPILFEQFLFQTQELKGYLMVRICLVKLYYQSPKSSHSNFMVNKTNEVNSQNLSTLTQKLSSIPPHRVWHVCTDPALLVIGSLHPAVHPRQWLWMNWNEWDSLLQAENYVGGGAGDRYMHQSSPRDTETQGNIYVLKDLLYSLSSVHSCELVKHWTHAATYGLGVEVRNHHSMGAWE